MHFFGEGLYLQVTGTGAKSWIFRYSRDGKARWMGLGSVRHVSLANARKLVSAARVELIQGNDPVAVKQKRRVEQRLEAAKAITFKQVAADYIKEHQVDWRNPKHAVEWENTLARYVYPTIGDLPVGAIDTQLVLKCLNPIWTEKAETARRVRGRIEAVLDAATVMEQREGPNPARWRGHLSHKLSAGSQRKVKHHAALPYAEIGTFMEELHRCEGVAARALEFAILTASRTGEVIGAAWSEIDLRARLWVVAAHRMKAGREHRVPLSASAMAVLGRMEAHRQGDVVFPSLGRNRQMSNMAMLKVLETMGRRHEITVHGFRSTFRDWAAERTNFPREVAEMALAHAIGDAVEAAYRRGDLFEKRRRLMDAWAEFCAKLPTIGTVVPIRVTEA
jgi:integrase